MQPTPTPPDEARGPDLSRRQFLAAAAAAGLVVSLPFDAAACGAASPTTGYRASTGAGLFLVNLPGRPRRDTCAALCARIVPAGADPRIEPGAAETGAVDFIDLFLSAFDLPVRVGDHPAVWIHGRYSGRNPYPDNVTGEPSRRYPASDFVSPDGQRHFLALTRGQEMSWRAQLYGREALSQGWVSPKWLSQVGGLIPDTTVTLRDIYTDGLDAFEQYCLQVHGASVGAAGSAAQDQLLAAASGDQPASPPAPAAATALFPYLVAHTFQACYALPEYGGNRGGMMWRRIGWDGDTQPLGNSVYAEDLAGPGEGPNRGFGQAGVYQPRGGYREFRPVSGP